MDRRPGCRGVQPLSGTAHPPVIAITNRERLVDFSTVTSHEEAVQLANQGQLVKVLLFPAEFGGQSVPQNLVYVPPAIAAIKDQITGTLIDLIRDGTINQLEVLPEYKGDSFVPAKILIKAWHSDRPGGFEPTIEVW